MFAQLLNRVVAGTKSGGYFCLSFLILGLSACDQKSGPIKISQEQISAHAIEKTATQINLTELKRGTYQPLNLDLYQLSSPDQAHLIQDLLEGLVIVDKSGDIQPAMAEKWETKDNRNWIFYLRADAKWSNGEPVTAIDFVQSWQKLSQSHSSLASYLAFLNLKNAVAVINGELPAESLGISALDKKRLQIQLDKPTPYLPKMLAHIALLPSYQQATDKFISNGAYQLNAWQDKQAELIRNPYYWNKEQVKLEKVVYQQILPEQALENFDWVEMPEKAIPNISYVPRLCSYFYEFNLKQPKLQHLGVRQALVSMVSTQNLLPNNQSMIANGINFLPRNMQFEQQRDWQPTVLEQQLQQAGISEKNPLKLRLSYDGQGIHKIIAERLIALWSQSDLLRIEPNPMNYQQLLSKRAEGDFDIIRSGWCADYNDPSAFLMLLHSQHPDNKGRITDPKIDDALKQILTEKLSDAEREKRYQQLTLYMQSQSVILSLFQYAKPIYISPTITGYDLKNPTEVFYSKDLFRVK